MRRPLFVVNFLVFLAIGSLSADQSAELRPSQRRLAIENMLDSPLNWEPGDREHVTLAEVIAYVREEHDLQVRWDVGSLGVIFGDQSPLGGLLSTSDSQREYYAPPHLGSGIPTYSGTTHPSPHLGQPQLQPPPYATPSQSAAAELPSVPDPGYAVGSTNASPPLLANNQVDEPESDTPSTDQPDKSSANGTAAVIAEYQTSPIQLSAVSLERATVREGLQQLLGAVSVPTSTTTFSAGLPFTTRALALDLLVDENSVLITTQLRANAKKETRVYRLDSLSEIPPESLVRVITHSVRPWSWRNQANEIAEQLASRWPKNSIPLPAIELDATEGIKLTSAEQGSDAAVSPNAMPEVSADTVAATGQLVAGSALAAAQSIVAALEIVHHGDPPTGVIESLPGILIITQSQAAHREIKELLYELGEAE